MTGIMLLIVVAQTAEDISLYMLNRGYTIDREYYTDSSVSPQYWGNQSWNFGGGLAGNRVVLFRLIFVNRDLPGMEVLPGSQAHQ